MDPLNPAWLTAPYYTPPAPQRVECGQWYGSHPLAETMMQSWLAAEANDPMGFLYGRNGSGPQAPRALLDLAIAMAEALTEQAPQVVAFTCVGFEPLSRAVYYANQLFDILKRIPATVGAPLAGPGVSVFDVWTAVKP